MWKIALGLLVCCVLNGCVTTSAPETSSVAEWGSNPEYARASYDEALEFLSKGRQKDAEWLIADACAEAPDSQRLHFLNGVLWRSRFENQIAREEFLAVYKLDKDTDLAAMSRAVISMDQGLAVESGFEKLAAQYEVSSNELLARWLYGIEARYHERHAEEAARQFRALFKEWDIGPVMAHQTYAKLLTTDLRQPKKALEHRLLAVELEPEPWSYQGLANTYKALQRFEDADLVYGKLLETQPYNSIYWIQWGTCRFYMGEYEDAAMLFDQALLLNPKDVSALIFSGRCLEREGEPEKGYANYLKALKRAPGHPQAKAYAAHAKLFGYGTDPNFEEALQLCRLPGKPAIDLLRDMVRHADESENPIAPEKSATLLPKLFQRGQAGDAEAWYSLGMIHRYGIGVAESEAAAMKWFALAAENGHEIARREVNPPE